MPNNLENVKIVWWIDNLRTGGAQQDVCRFVRDFARYGARQSLICFAEKGNESFISRIEATGTRVYKIKKKKIFFIVGLITIWNILRRDSFDISIACLTGAELFGSFSVFVLASSFEGMSNSLLEAMSNGCPVVVSHVDGNRELVQHRDTGLVFDPGNIGQLKEMLSVMLLDRKFAKGCGDRARALVREKYSEEDQFYNWSQLILRLHQSVR